MIYLDYIWDLSSKGILLDPELKINQLNWQPGDTFVLRVTDSGRAILEKQIQVNNNGQSS